MDKRQWPSYSQSTERRQISMRSAVRTYRHGNWRQTYIDCAGVCVAKVNGDDHVCGAIQGLELHEVFGESRPGEVKIQQRIVVCSLHHSLIEDKAHQARFMFGERCNNISGLPSKLAEDINSEIEMCGGYQQWLKKYKLDDYRFGCMVNYGPHVQDWGDG